MGVTRDKSFNGSSHDLNIVHCHWLVTPLSRAWFFPVTNRLHPVRAHPSSRGPYYRNPNHESRLDPQLQAEAEEVKAWLVVKQQFFM